MLKILSNAQIITNDGVVNGAIVIENGRIIGVERREPETGEVPARRIDLGGRYLSPGFIDLHTHGAGGSDFLECTKEAVETAAKAHLAHGTTTLLPTFSACNGDEMKRSVDAFRAAKKMENGPALAGIHFEAPYINVKQKGAFEDRYIKAPDPEEYRSVMEYADGDILRWTAAPELKGAMEFGRYISARGALPSIGHSDAEYSHVREAFQNGFTHVTHLYSACSTVVRREGFRHLGVVESAFLMDGMTVEVIADGFHMPPELLRMVVKIKGAGSVCMVTDAMRIAGTDVTGEVLARKGRDRKVLIEDGVAKLTDRSAFAGSIATCDRLVRVMWKEAGVPLPDCIRMMCKTPAVIAGLDRDRGTIQPGKRADLVAFDEDVNVYKVFVEGNVVYPKV